MSEHDYVVKDISLAEYGRKELTQHKITQRLQLPKQACLYLPLKARAWLSIGITSTSLFFSPKARTSSWMMAATQHFIS